MFKQKKKNYSNIDWKLPLIVALLCIFGLVILYSATLSMHSTKYIKTQIIATILGILLIGVLTLMDFDLIKKLSIPLYVLGNALLVLTLIKGVGGTEWGADSWLRIGSISFQPSEFMKIILILSLALMIEKYHERINEPKVLLELLIFVGSGAASSWSINNLGRKIAREDFSPGFFVKHFVKDMGIALAEARKMGIALPGLALVEQLYVAAMAQGFENMGTQALYNALLAMSPAR